MEFIYLFLAYIICILSSVAQWTRVYTYRNYTTQNSKVLWIENVPVNKTKTSNFDTLTILMIKIPDLHDSEQSHLSANHPTPVDHKYAYTCVLSMFLVGILARSHMMIPYSHRACLYLLFYGVRCWCYIRRGLTRSRIQNWMNWVELSDFCPEIPYTGRAMHIHAAHSTWFWIVFSVLHCFGAAIFITIHGYQCSNRDGCQEYTNTNKYLEFQADTTSLDLTARLHTSNNVQKICQQHRFDE